MMKTLNKMVASLVLTVLIATFGSIPTISFAAEQCPTDLSSSPENSEYKSEYLKACALALKSADTATYKTNRPPTTSAQKEFKTSDYPQTCESFANKVAYLTDTLTIKLKQKSTFTSDTYYDNEFYGCFEGYQFGINLRDSNLSDKSLTVAAVSTKCSAEKNCIIGYIGYINGSTKSATCQGIDFAKCSAGFEKAKTEFTPAPSPSPAPGPSPAPSPSPAPGPSPAPSPSPAPGPNGVITLENPLTADDLPTLLKTIFNKALLYITYVIPIVIIIGAFQMMFAAGNPEKFASGRNTIVYAIIGYVIVLMANGIIAIVQSLLSTT